MKTVRYLVAQFTNFKSSLSFASRQRDCERINAGTTKMTNL